MAAAIPLTDLQNWTLFFAREMDSVAFGGTPNYSAQFPAVFLTDAINQAVDELIAFTGFSPKLTDVAVSQAVTSAVDYGGPSNMTAIQRVEYQQNSLVQGTITSGAITGSATAQTVTYTLTSGSEPVTQGTALLVDTLASGQQETVQVTAAYTLGGINYFTAIFTNNHNASCTFASGALRPYRLNMKTFDEFDALAGTGFAPTTVVTLGLPWFYREPVNSGAGWTIRFYPAISSTQVANGDTIIFTGTTLGTTLVNPTDVLNVPIPFQRCAAMIAAQDIWGVKGDDDQIARLQKKIDRIIMQAKAYRWDLMSGTVFGIIDEAVDATFYSWDGGSGAYDG